MTDTTSENGPMKVDLSDWGWFLDDESEQVLERAFAEVTRREVEKALRTVYAKPKDRENDTGVSPTIMIHFEKDRLVCSVTPPDGVVCPSNEYVAIDVQQQVEQWAEWEFSPVHRSEYLLHASDIFRRIGEELRAKAGEGGMT